MNSSKIKQLLTQYKEKRWNITSHNRTIKALTKFSDSPAPEKELTQDEQFQLAKICLEVDKVKHVSTAEMASTILDELGSQQKAIALKQHNIFTSQTYALLLKYPTETQIVFLIKQLLATQPDDNYNLERLLEGNYPQTSLDTVDACLTILDEEPGYISSDILNLLLDYATDLNAINNVLTLLKTYATTSNLPEALHLLTTESESIKSGKAYDALFNFVLKNSIPLTKFQLLIINNKSPELENAVKTLEANSKLPSAIKEKTLITILNYPEHQNTLINALQSYSDADYLHEDSMFNTLVENFQYADKLWAGIKTVSSHYRSYRYNSYLQQMTKHSNFAPGLAQAFCAMEKTNLSTKSRNELFQYLSNHPEQAEHIAQIIKGLYQNSICTKENITKVLQPSVISAEFAAIMQIISHPPILSSASLDKLISTKDYHKQLAPAVNRLSKIKQLTAETLQGLLDNPQKTESLVNLYCSNSNTTFFKKETKETKAPTHTVQNTK